MDVRIIDDLLYLIYSDNKRDADLKNLASLLISKFKLYKFIFSLVIWYDVLSKINIVSKALQKSDVAWGSQNNISSKIQFNQNSYWVHVQGND